MDEPTNKEPLISELSSLRPEDWAKLRPDQQKEFLKLAKTIFSKPKGSDYEAWLRANFAAVMTKPLALRHHTLWKWFASLELGVPNVDHIHNAPRGGGKSAHLELGVVYCAVKETRKLALYVSGTQLQANKHIQSIRKHFERMNVTPRLSNYGGANSAWRADMLMTSNGFSIVGVGLDTSLRGLRIEDLRPDLLIFDDVDAREDSKNEVASKILTITDSIIPSGSDSSVVVFGQNIIHKDSIMSQLLSDEPPFITGRVIGANEPAILDMVTEDVKQPDGTYRTKIVSGTPTWVGQSIAFCNREIEKIGLRAFMREHQHHVKGENPDALFTKAVIDRARVRPQDVPPVGRRIRTRVALDIAVTTSKQSDTTAIGVGCVTEDGHFYIFTAMDGRWKPAAWAKKAIALYRLFGAQRIAAEKNQGGDMIESTIHTVKRVPVSLIHVHQAKEVRAEAVSALYELGRVHHVGVLSDLEDEMVSWVPGLGRSPNLIDMIVILLMELDPRIRSGNLQVYSRLFGEQAVDPKGVVDEYEDDDYDERWPKMASGG